MYMGFQEMHHEVLTQVMNVCSMGTTEATQALPR